MYLRLPSFACCISRHTGVHTWCSTKSLRDRTVGLYNHNFIANLDVCLSDGCAAAAATVAKVAAEDLFCPLPNIHIFVKSRNGAISNYTYEQESSLSTWLRMWFAKDPSVNGRKPSSYVLAILQHDPLDFKFRNLVIKDFTTWIPASHHITMTELSSSTAMSIGDIQRVVGSID